ncbi:MAG: hypothetical protein K0Q72_4859 [Armatimonadetes bacterium]|nr:hypothetical protein [Armatimonadota bacterium]
MIPPLGLAVWAAGLVLAVAAGVGFRRRSRPPALRSRSVALGAAGVLAARWLVLALDFRLGGAAELLWHTAYLLLAAGWIVPGEWWLIRSPAAEVEARLEQGGRALLVALQWPAPGRFMLPARGLDYQGRVVGVGSRLSLLWLPDPGKKGKARLLVNWLGKQYPGPFPRPHIALKRRQP